MAERMAGLLSMSSGCLSIGATQSERAGCYRARQRSARDWYLTPGICPLDTYPVPLKTTIADIVG